MQVSIPSKAVGQFKNNVVAAGGSLNSTELNAANYLIGALKANYLWNKFDTFVWFFNFGAAFVPLKGATPTNTGFVSGDFNEGLQGNGTNKWLQSNQPILRTNTGHLMAYIPSITVTGTHVALGVRDSGSNQVWHLDTTASNTRAAFGATATASYATPLAPGIWTSQREASNSLKLYESGTQRASGSTSPTISPLATGVGVFAKATSSSPAAVNFFPGKIRAYSIGDMLSVNDLTILTNILTNTKTILGWT
jgi:hypothetical protein